jgi:hypothetical protein
MEQIIAEFDILIEMGYSMGLDGQDMFDAILDHIEELALAEGDDIVARRLGH